MQSESRKELLIDLCDAIRIASTNTETADSGKIADFWLPKTKVYDDCYHVVKHIIDYYPNFFCQTHASTFLYHSSFSINAYHYQNHTGKLCQQNLNPNQNEIVKHSKIQSAEQSNF
ncbi:unnamed protein product [Rotaria sp. Silwood2]|nr:unnamed protein product [Rotaria sp. Silwood2]CAF4109873.1 unnamed protein product [Rotaria sp. Silwood2]